MTFAFDLISDLHMESWPEFNWEHQPTSQFCVVAGDVAQDHTLLIDALEHLGKCYRAVFYIDGNDEHRNRYNEIGENYKDLVKNTHGIPNVVYLQDNVVLIDGVAILGTNGWWTWDFDLNIDAEQCSQWFCEKVKCNRHVPSVITSIATTDARYIASSVNRLQTHPDVKKIVLVTHTVPDSSLISHDISLVGDYRHNCMGNSLISQALAVDYERKISHWCFGHYHSKVDRYIDGVRFVNNCRGRSDSEWKQSVYFPLRIEVDF